MRLRRGPVLAVMGAGLAIAASGCGTGPGGGGSGSVAEAGGAGVAGESAASMGWFDPSEARRLPPTASGGDGVVWDRRVVSAGGVIHTVLAERGGVVRLASAASDWPEAVDLGPAAGGVEDLALTRDAERLLMLVRRDGGFAVYEYDLAEGSVQAVRPVAGPARGRSR